MGAAAGGRPLRGLRWEMGAAPRPARRRAREGVGVGAGLLLGKKRGHLLVAGTHTPATCHTSLLGLAFSHAWSWHGGPGHAGTCPPHPRKVGEPFLWAWGQGPLQVETWPGVGEPAWSGGAALQHPLSSCRRPGPHWARVPARPACLDTPHPRRQRAWAGGRGGRFPSFLEWDPGTWAKAMPLSGLQFPFFEIGDQNG